MDKEYAEPGSEIKILGDEFEFKKFLDEYHRIFTRGREGLQKILDMQEKMRTIDFLRKIFISDAEKIKSKFEKQSISRKDARWLYNLLDKLIRQIEKTIYDMNRQLEELKYGIDRLFSTEGRSIRDVVDDLCGEIDKIKDFPKEDFGILEIDIASIHKKDVKDIEDFFEDHLSGVLVIPEEKKKLGLHLPDKKFSIERKILTNKIVFTFASGDESKSEKLST